MAVECFSILFVTDILCENLSTYDEVKLYGACTAIYHGNKVHRDWLMRLRDHIHAYYDRPALPKSHSHGSHEQPQGEPNAPPPQRLSLENIAEHENNMGNDKRKIKHMPGETIEQNWFHYIHRKPLNGYERSSSSSSSSYDPMLSSNEDSSSNDRGNPQCMM